MRRIAGKARKMQPSKTLLLKIRRVFSPGVKSRHLVLNNQEWRLSSIFIEDESLVYEK